MTSIFKTLLLLGTLSALFVAVGYSIGGPDQAWVFFFISLAINIGAYWWSESIALRMAGAKSLERGQIPGLYDDLESLCQRMGIPMPKVYYAPARQANAFATGRNPRHSSICFTQGILGLLDREELMAVAGHELSHIKNRDVLIVTIAAVLASAISGIGRMAFWFGGSRDNHRSNEAAGLLMIIFAPIAALLLQMAISRQREFAADESGARATYQPQALARALEKIDHSVNMAPLPVNPAIASLYIENPLKLSGILSLFSTHPPTAQRVERLQKLTL